MAYSDYGGYAYKNGVRVVDRSDAVLSPEGIKSTPGMWPGWTLDEGRNGGSYHVLLGDGPIFVSLYKQSSLGIHKLDEHLDKVALLKDPQPGDTDSYESDGKTVRYVNTDAFINDDRKAVFEVEGCVIEVLWEYGDNYYQYAKLTQPDGTVWTGFSGYGVGAGLEDAGYGYSTDDCEDRLQEIFQ